MTYPFSTRLLALCIAGAILYALHLRGFIAPLAIAYAVGELIWWLRAGRLEKDPSYLDPLLQFYKDTDPETVTDEALEKLFDMPSGMSMRDVRRITLLCKSPGADDGFANKDFYAVRYADIPQSINKGVKELWTSPVRGMYKSRERVVATVKPWLIAIARKRHIEVYENQTLYSNIFPIVTYDKQPAEDFGSLSTQALRDIQEGWLAIQKLPDGSMSFRYGTWKTSVEIGLGSSSLTITRASPAVSKSVPKTDILAFVSTPDMQILVSTLSALPEQLFLIPNAAHRDLLLRLCDAWLHAETT